MFSFNAPSVTEIAPDVYRIGMYAPPLDLQFNFFLVRDEQPLLFEETQRTLFCSDLFHHNGDVEPLTESDLSHRVRPAISQMQTGPLANYLPYSPRTEMVLGRLADLKPKTLAIMHGSSFTGDGERALRDLAVVMRETLGDPSPAH